LKGCYFGFIAAETQKKPVPVFPWHSLVPFLTNSGSNVSAPPGGSQQQEPSLTPISAQTTPAQLPAANNTPEGAHHSVSETRKFSSFI